MSLLGPRGRGGGLFCFLHGIFDRRAGVGPAENKQEKNKKKYNVVNNMGSFLISSCVKGCDSHLGLVFILVCVSRS